MKVSRSIVAAGFFLCLSFIGAAQRSYAPHSVLSSGNWYKIAVKEAGIYKIDIPFLNSLGINTSSISSGSIRLYSNGGSMLPEANSIFREDDLKENSIMVVDGGDGVFNGADYILFYAKGPDDWLKDSAALSFTHKKNIYTDKAYYFLSVGGTGKRIASSNNNFSPNVTINTFSERIFHELDTVNFLSSGKEWYGEEMANAPGKSLTRSFTVSVPNIQTNSNLVLQSNLVARSPGTASHFDVSINNVPLGQININAVGTGQFDLFAQEVT
ncbi:MAG: hypothetical protein JJE22_20460, partial [Bacteroidia bacterium]|nr:hypothetical protein [Bacteroidia bacterium]